MKNGKTNESCLQLTGTLDVVFPSSKLLHEGIPIVPERVLPFVDFRCWRKADAAFKIVRLPHLMKGCLISLPSIQSAYQVLSLLRVAAD